MGRQLSEEEDLSMKTRDRGSNLISLKYMQESRKRNETPAQRQSRKIVETETLVVLHQVMLERTNSERQRARLKRNIRFLCRVAGLEAERLYANHAVECGESLEEARTYFKNTALQLAA